MTTSLKVHKLNAVPTQYTASSLYFVKNQSTQTFDVFLTSNDGQLLYRSISISDVEILLESMVDVPSGIAGLNANGIIPAIDGQNTAIKSAGSFVWYSTCLPFVVKSSSGTNNPVFDTVSGNMQGLLFSNTVMNQVWVDVTIGYDYASGTVVYPSIHWMPVTSDTGTVRWGVEYIVAKGHGQQVFSSPTTVYIEHSVSAASSGKHMISEVSLTDAIAATSLEPDTVIKMRVFRDATHTNDTLEANVHAWQANIRYQRGQLGTRSRAPDFFTLPA